MDDMWVETVVRAMHQQAGRAVVVTAGAGTAALQWLFGVAGASRTILEARVPYSERAFAEFCGRVPRQFVSARAARWLAGNACQRAYALTETRDEPLFGVSCTATIATDRVKRGEHRAHVALWRAEEVTTFSLTLTKGARSRHEEERLVSALLLNSMAQAWGVGTRPLALLAGEVVEREVVSLDTAVAEFLAQDSGFMGVYADGRVKSEGINPQLLLCGSFNPLHAGHVALAEAAMAQTGQPIAFEIGVRNVDKPTLTRAVVLARMCQFAGRWPLYLTHAPTFAEKVRLFPETRFVVGYDTAVRIYNPRYYQSEAAMLAALGDIDAQGGRFLVAGRVDGRGHYRTADELTPPSAYAHLFEPLEAFRRIDLSSTEIRAGG